MFRLAQALDDLTRHRADIGAAMAANFGLIAHTAQRHADKFASRRAGDGFSKRCLANPRRSDKAQDRAFQFGGAFLHGKIFKDALLDLFQAVMVRVQNGLGARQINVAPACACSRE